MKVLLLGGTGAMGVHLVKMLAEKNVDTFVTTRKAMNSHGTVQYVQIDAQNLLSLQPWLDQKWDAIVDFMVYTTDVFKDRYENLLSATSQYIFISSARVYAYSDRLIEENSPRLLDTIDDAAYLETDEYALSKARQEDILRKSTINNWTIIRPYITYNESRLQFGVFEKEDWLFRAINGRSVVFSREMLSKKTTLTYGRDVARGIANVIGEISSLGEVYHITSNESVTWEFVFSLYSDVLFKVLGIKPNIVVVDSNDFFSLHDAYYQIKYDRLYDRSFNTDKFSKYLSSSDFTRLDVGIRLSLETFLVNPEFQEINWINEATKDRITNENTSIFKITGSKNKIRYLMVRYFHPLYKTLNKMRS